MAVDIVKISWDDSVTPYIEEYHVYIDDVYTAAVQPGTREYLYASTNAYIPTKYEVQAKDANGITVLEVINLNVIVFPAESDIALDSLLDVTILDPQTGQALIYDYDTGLWSNQGISQYVVDRQITKQEGEPAGFTIATNQGVMTKPDYDAAAVAGELNDDTLYLIKAV